MEPKLIYMLYQKLANEQRDQLARIGMLPDINNPDKTYAGLNQDNYGNRNQ